MKTRTEKATLFRELHQRSSAFIIPNPWDVGSARLLAHLGFEALATTSVGFAFSIGRQDHGVTRDEAIEHAAAIVAATDLPVSADLENGFGDDPETVATTIEMAAGAGLAGCSIEDSTNRPDDPIYEFDLAVDRVRAAAEAARSPAIPFTLTARSENYLHGRRDLADTIRRLTAFQEAGADVLFAPGITDMNEIATLVRSVDRPVNVVASMQGAQFDLAELSKIGVKRVSVGGALSRVALAACIRAAKEMRDHGTFTFADEPISSREIAAMLALSTQ
jgi:2-methylisocitrate lyase-like PEP mutase family enzyme